MPGVASWSTAWRDLSYLLSPSVVEQQRAVTAAQWQERIATLLDAATDTTATSAETVEARAQARAELEVLHERFAPQRDLFVKVRDARRSAAGDAMARGFIPAQGVRLWPRDHGSGASS